MARHPSDPRHPSGTVAQLSLLVAGLLMALAGWAATPHEVGRSAALHAMARPATIMAGAQVGESVVREMAEEVGVALSPTIGDVLYAERCEVQGAPTLHLVMRTTHELATVLLIGGRIAPEDLTGLAVRPVPGGAVAVHASPELAKQLADHLSDLGPVERAVRR